MESTHFEVDMGVTEMEKQWRDLRGNLLCEEVLDEQFDELMQLQDENTPKFVNEVFSIYFRDAQNIIDDISATLEKPFVDFKNISSNVHKLKGSSSSVGAKKVKNVCIEFRSLCETQNTEGCLRALQQLQNEFSFVKQKLTQMFELEENIAALRGSY